MVADSSAYSRLETVNIVKFMVAEVSIEVDNTAKKFDIVRGCCPDRFPTIVQNQPLEGDRPVMLHLCEHIHKST